MQQFSDILEKLETIDPWAIIIALAFLCFVFVYLIVKKSLQIFRSKYQKNKFFKSLIQQYENENHHE